MHILNSYLVAIIKVLAKIMNSQSAHHLSHKIEMFAFNWEWEPVQKFNPLKLISFPSINLCILLFLRVVVYCIYYPAIHLFSMLSLWWIKFFTKTSFKCGINFVLPKKPIWIRFWMWNFQTFIEIIIFEITLVEYG